MRPLRKHAPGGDVFLDVNCKILASASNHHRLLCTRFNQLASALRPPQQGRLTIFRMRSRLLVFLLVLLPLQLCWAAVGAYCHEGRLGSAPVATLNCCEHGQLRGNSQALKPASSVAACQESALNGDGAAHADCSACHPHGSEAFHAYSAFVPGAGQECFDAATGEWSCPAHASRPERPQWPALA